MTHEQTLRLIRHLHELGVQIDIVPRLFEVIGTNFGIHTAEGLPMIGLPSLKLSRSALLLKRMLDVALALGGLVLVAPLFAASALAIKLDSRGPVFFRQVRRGANERVFRIYKFRTMCDDAEERKAELRALNKHNGNGGDPRMFKIPDDPRVTRVGRVLRRYSLDEMPQLINVLKGEMSLVGRGRSSSRRISTSSTGGAGSTEAGHYRALAGARAGRDPLRGDGQARLSLRDVLVDAERRQAHSPYDSRRLSLAYRLGGGASALTVAETIILGGNLAVRRLGLGTMELTGHGTWGSRAILRVRALCCNAHVSWRSTSSIRPTRTARR